jgi:hypothetical protein
MLHAYIPSCIPRVATFMRMSVQVRTRWRFPARQRVARKSYQCSDDNPCLSHKSSRICMGWARHASAVAAPPPPLSPRRLCPLFGIRIVSLVANICVYQPLCVQARVAREKAPVLGYEPAPIWTGRAGRRSPRQGGLREGKVAIQQRMPIIFSKRAV